LWETERFIGHSQRGVDPSMPLQLMEKHMKIMKNMGKKQGGFTLLELLVVVGIMAIVGGAMISSFGGQEGKAARGAATATIAGVEDAFRIFKADTGNIPNELESLVCAPVADAAAIGGVTNIVATALANGTAAAANTAFPFGGTSNASGIGGGLGKKLADKFTLQAVPAGGITALADVGVVSLRYAAAFACDNETASPKTTAVTFATGEIINIDQDLQDADIPNHAFEDPRPGASTDNRNRGRGFSGTLTAGAPLMVWKTSDGYNNKKLGAPATAILVGMGLGQASDLVGNDGSAAFAKAPFYGQVGKDKYAHYVALINIGNDDDATAPATPFSDGDLTTGTQTYFSNGEAAVQAIVDARGDFLDEEVAEFRGQKT